MPLAYKRLGDAIKDIYIHADNYMLDKYVPTFTHEGKFLGDFFNYVMVEPRDPEPPIFYHIYSPYDVISGKSSQHAAILQRGELLYTAEISEYVQQRTGVMTPLILSVLGKPKLADERVLFIGTGRIATCALNAMHGYFPDLHSVSYVSHGPKSDSFEAQAASLGLSASPVTLSDLAQFDIIICHTSSHEPVLTPEMRSQIKPGAFISAFASEDFVEVAEEFYDTNVANVLIDWPQTITEARELQAAVDSGIAVKDSLLELKDVFSETKQLDAGKHYTIYRSHGTPMQNLAVLKLLAASS